MLSDANFLAAFENHTLPDNAFRHGDHLRLAWLYLKGESLLVVLRKFPEALREFATAKGQPGLYHETVTWAYLILIHERMHRSEDDLDWPSFLRRHPELLEKSLLERYYRAERLTSDFARTVFILPDAALLL